MKNIILTGHKGFLGSLILEKLSPKYNIIGLDLPEFDLLNDNLHSLNLPNIDGLIISHALNPTEQLLDDVSSSVSVEEKAFQVNVFSVRKLVDHLLSKNFSLQSTVHISSIYACIASDFRLYPKGDKPYWYGASKAACNNMIKHYAVRHKGTKRFNNIILGGVYNAGMSQEFVESYSLKTSIGRMLNPIEVITPIDFLLERVALQLLVQIFQLMVGI